MDQMDRMLNGLIYSCRIKDEKREKLRRQCKEFLDKFNSTSFTKDDERSKLAQEMFHSVGKNCNINKPFYCDYGCHISIGDNFYANYDCIFLDVNKITIGNNVFFGPRVCLYTAAHPLDKDVRNEHFVYGKEITIGSDVWIGGNTIINPGIKIANNVIIGSGSVVTKDIPSGVIAAGNPCKIIRKITNEDIIFWKLQKENFENDLKNENDKKN